MRFLILLFFINLSCLCACGQETEETKQFVNPLAKKLNDSALAVTMHSQDYVRALVLLDEAIKIDSNFITALSNKVSFQLMLKQFDDAIITAKKIIRINPQVPGPHFLTGMIYIMSGDSISSQKYFNEAAICFDRILDSMNKTSKYYDMVLMNKAVNLIFMGEPQKGNEILMQLYNNEKDEFRKELFSEYMNKSRAEIISDFLNPKQDTSSTWVPSLDLEDIKFSKIKDTSRYKFPAGLYLLKEVNKNSGGFKLRDADEYYYVAKDLNVSLGNIDTVYKVFDKHYKSFVLVFNFNGIGAKELSDFTMKCINQKIGFLIYNKLITAAQVYGSIDRGKMTLTGKFTENEIDNMEQTVEYAIKDLKKVLKNNAHF